MFCDAHRARLVEIAARRGDKGFPRIAQEALDRYSAEEGGRKERVEAALALGGTLSQKASEATTSINAFELGSGAREGREHAKVEVLLAALTILPVDGHAADLAAGVRRDLEKKGNGIRMADYLIAGVCLAHEGTLLTRNVDHFGRVHGLRIGGNYRQDPRTRLP